MADQDRGEFRTLYRSLFDDADYQALSSEAEHVLVTLKATLPVTGIGVVPAWSHVYARRCHRTAKSVTAAIAELQGRPWIEVQGDVLWVIRGLEFEPNMQASNLNHRKYIQQLISGLPRIEIVSRFRAHYAKWFDKASTMPSGITSPMPSGRHRQGGVVGDRGSQDKDKTKTRQLPRTAANNAAEHARFGEVWQLYPRRPGDSRAKALRAFGARVREGVNPDALLAGVRAYAAHIERERTRPSWEPRFIKQGATFFGAEGRHWESDWGPADDEMIQVYDERGEMSSEVAALLGAKR